MSTHPATNLNTSDFAPFIPARAGTPIELRVADLGLLIRKPTVKDSIVAGAVTLGYLGVYLAVGFAALSAASWAWAAFFG
jgi:hypothetical protein